MKQCIFCGKEANDNKIITSFLEQDKGICLSCLQEVAASFKLPINTKPKKKMVIKGKEAKLLKPHEIKTFLDEYVIGQHNAKRTLAIAIYNHMKRLALLEKSTDVEIEKSNVLMLGPSGCGKTHMIKTLAKLLNVPYAIVDSTTLTESGYVGSDVEIILQKLYYAAGGDVEEAERGIVFIDEIDKKANKQQENTSITRDVSGEGVLQALLKLLEGNVVDVQLTGQRRHPYGDTVAIDTSKILFIAGGAFLGIEKLIAARLNLKERRPIGIGVEQDNLSTNLCYNDLIEKVDVKDLLKFGMIPELLGRFPIICPMKELGEKDLCRILTEPKNALVKQYSELLKFDGLSLDFDEDALALIANKAIQNGTGARGLRSQLERILKNAMYSCKASSGNNDNSIHITADMVKIYQPAA